MDRNLALHRSYTRVAARKQRAGQLEDAELYRKIARGFLAQYHRDSKHLHPATEQPSAA